MAEQGGVKCQNIPETESYIPRIKDNRIVTLIYMGLGYLNQKNRNYALSIDYFKDSVSGQSFHLAAEK